MACADEDKFKPFINKKDEITAYKDGLMWGNRVIIPPGERKVALHLFHTQHPGIVKMKALPRSYLWWPELDSDIEKLVATCLICQENRAMPHKAPLHRWEWPQTPWLCLHIDHAGPVEGNYLLLVVDAHSKWLEVRRVPSTSTANTIAVLRELFATHGLPDVIMELISRPTNSVHF